MHKFFKSPIFTSAALVSLTAYWTAPYFFSDDIQLLPAKSASQTLTNANPSQPVANIALETTTASDAKLAALSTKVAELKNTVIALEHTLQIQTKRIDTVLSTVSQNTPPNQELTSVQLQAMQASHPQAKLEMQMQAEFYKSSVEKHFNQEAENPAWAASAANQVVGSFKNGNYGSAAIRDLKCKSSLCRVELEYDLATTQSSGPDQSQPDELSNLLNSALSKTENPQTNKGTAVIFIGHSGLNLS